MKTRATFLTGVGTGGGLALCAAFMMGQADQPRQLTGQPTWVTGHESGGHAVAIGWRLSADGNKLESVIRGRDWQPLAVQSAADAGAVKEARADSPASPENIEREARRQQQAFGEVSPDSGVKGSNMSVCAGSPIPDGWIKVNDHWNPNMCGNPGNIVYNVW